MTPPNPNEQPRRILNDNDAAIVANIAIEAAKVGVTALALVNGAPEAAVGLAMVSGLGGALLKKQEMRLTEFLQNWKRKNQKLSPEERQHLETNLQSEAGERIFEEAWRIAASCVDPEKLGYLSELLSKGLASPILAEHQTRRLLGLVESLDAVDFVILQSHLEQNSLPSLHTNPTQASSHQEGYQAFRAKHEAIFADEKPPQEPHHPRSSYWVAYPSTELSEEEKTSWNNQLTTYHQARERHALFQNRIHRLIELGVLGVEGHYSSSVHAGLTPLGMALLKIVGAAPDNEWGSAEATGSLQVAQRIEDERQAARRDQAERDKEQQQREQRAAREVEQGVRDFKNQLRNIR